MTQTADVFSTTSLNWTAEDQRAVDTVRVLAADSVEKVGNGHPGTAMSLAPVAYLLFQKLMRHDPSDSEWLGRDRFILSPGHSSLTLYIQLFLAGYGLELEDLQSFRTWGSLTPGHPEYKHTKGVEITTGPLGQGLASSVGFAYSQRRMRGLFDADAAPGTSPFDHTVWVIASDGDLQEGVTSEACSLAGHQELGNLVVVYDENHISIEDDTDISFTEDVLKRYESYGWHVQRVDWTRTGEYKEDIEELHAALQAAKAETSKPSIISLRTIIGYPAPKKQNTGKIHGSALGAEEVAAVKEVLGFDPAKSFEVDPAILAHTRAALDRGAAARSEWDGAFKTWQAGNPEGDALLQRIEAKELPAGIEAVLPVFEAGKDVSTRAASGKVLNALGPVLPELWGGSADLAESNNTTIEGSPSFIPASRSTSSWKGNPYGRVLHFGIREHAAASIVNGIVLHGPTRAFSGTFLIFSDYQRPAIRLSALMGVPSVYVWSHDSIGLGEDGPTHQPVEQLSTLRAIPGLDVVRPGDANEVGVAWQAILENHENPAGIVLTRQNIPTFARGEGAAEGDTFGSAAGVAKGGYVLAEASKDGATVPAQVLLIATGSEVHLAVQAREALQADGIPTRVVSMPCVEWFNKQDDAYRESVLPAAVTARVSVEAGLSLGWKEFVGDAGRSISLEHFGASADYKRLFTEFGITADAVVAAAKDSVAAAGN
ncbi:transketolase [Mycobacterium sp. CBMA293]|uniref:transketolase n=1 Tax=unclassified Mycolicibacterium TaxID=2636767 RepID=UPI0013288421|nr:MULTISPECIES: transketolase [unclassified Mycolicibacterium]MUL46517.1 transketolase [Mycolicibacterium sp. CBMA 360]MUL94542.1 transketolase [Mycolicibacterium sp. CBMA 230]MUM31543.1 transketolase [Mycolicibacterium sp. CBMA 361]MUL59184.1 transketolase [Mycolicibacterium sp. CBMA 335]MUL69578.1 transketolase [Mycolicibacterium sp. CBMA 311]